jgi:ferredoxin
MIDGLKNWGVPATQIRSETFGPEPSIRPGISNAVNRPVHLPAGDDGPGPEVSFTRSGLTVHWHSRFPSLLDLAEACDIPVRWSCRTGVCHTCECALIDGVVDYKPEPLERPAEGNALICCSYPATNIQVDL